MSARDLRHAAMVAGGFTLLFCWVFARPLLDGSYLSESDLYDYYLPVFLAPPAIWSGFEFAGMPAFADPENSTFYPLHVLFAATGSWTAYIMSAYVLAACFMYAYVYVHTRSVRGALLSGLAYALSEAMLERMAHPTIVHAIAWLPLILLAIDRVRLEHRRWTWAAIGAVAAANALLAGHPQLPVYMAYLCGAYALAGAVADRWRLPALAAGAGMAVGAAMLAAVILLPLAEISRYMARQSLDFTEFVSYSNSPAEMLSTIFPAITHIGREAPTYVGLGVLMLAPLGLYPFQWRAVFWMLVAFAALALGAGASTPLASAVYQLPLYDSFRIVARHLVFAAFAVATLAGFGIAAIEQGRVLRTGVAAAAGAVLLVVLAAAMVIAWRPEQFAFESLNESLGLPLWNSAVWGQFGIALLMMAACLGVARWPRATLSTAVLLVAVAGDLLHAYPGRTGALGIELETVPRAAVTPSIHTRALKREIDREHQRVFVPGGAQHNDIAPAMLARLWEIPTGGGNSSVAIDSIATLAMLPQLRSGDRAILAEANVALDMLAVKYLIFRAESLSADERSLLAGDRWRAASRVLTSRVSDRIADENAAGEVEYLLYENRRALPRAWLAREVLPVTDGALVDAAFGSRLRDGRTFDPRQTALVDEGQTEAATYPDGERDVRVESIADGRIRIAVTSTHGGFLVLSEAFYPGWQARIGDAPLQPVLRTNLALQGIAVPPGAQRVTFEFSSATRRAGAVASALGLLLVAAFIAFDRWPRTPASVRASNRAVRTANA